MKSNSQLYTLGISKPFTPRATMVMHSDSHTVGKVLYYLAIHCGGAIMVTSTELPLIHI
jgi:hypothetical protein